MGPFLFAVGCLLLAYLVEVFVPDALRAWGSVRRVACHWLNQVRVVVSVLKKRSSSWPNFFMPASEWCIWSLSRKSVFWKRKPSLRLFSPLAHQYGPQLSHGALTATLAGSKF